MNGFSLLLDTFYALALPPFYLWHRYISTRYGPQCYEKLGYPPARQAAAGGALPPCLWLHAVSVGEALAARSLVKGFAHAHPDWDIRISVTTATGREVAEKHFGAERVFYYPFDASWMVRRAFDRVRPNFVILMELEVWPNFIATAAARQVPVLVANARITERSARRFRAVGGWGRRFLSLVSHWCCQSEEYAERLRSLGVPPQRLEVVGSLKYDNLPTALLAETRAKYRQLFGLSNGERLLVAGSTHRGEEEAVLRAYGELRRNFPALRLALAPRHPERCAEVERLASRWAPVQRRSALTSPAEANAIILLDTMGELAALYAAADIVFIGGTLIPHGGQNMMEPCGLARPTIVGPSVFNFNDAMAALRAERGICEIAAAEELAAAVAALLADPASAVALGERGRAAVLKRQGATLRTLARVEALLAAGGAALSARDELLS